VLRRAFGNRGISPDLAFTADAEGLRVRAMFGDVAVEYRMAGKQPAETLCFPFQLLGDCEGKNDDPVELAAVEKGHLTAHWSDRGVPQIVRYDAGKPYAADKFPTLPEKLADNPATLLRAFTDTSDMADGSSARYTLGCIRLMGDDGSLAGTDGRQLLLESGFRLAWSGEVLVPRTKVFASPEFANGQPVLIGKSKEWVSVNLDPWFVHLRIDQTGRYPKVEQIVRPADRAVGVCRLSPADTRFLADALPRLPVSSDNDYRVTFDLNGQVIVRAKTDDQDKPTEVVLSSASWSGQPLRINVNCRQMARALKLGLSDLYVYGDEAPVAWYGETRKYLSSPLSRDCCIQPASDAIRIEAPTAGVEPSVTQRKLSRRKRIVADTPTNTNGQAGSNGAAKTNGQVRRARSRKAGQQDVTGLIEQAVKLRTALHDLTHQAADLVKSLKQHRRHSRAVQQTIAQLRNLKTLV
jgi:hypothetical protein